MKTKLSIETGILNKFLYRQNLMEEFVHNMQLHGRPDVTDTHLLIQYMHKHKHPLRQAFFLAFYWRKAGEKAEIFWKQKSREFKRHLEEINHSLKGK